MHDQRMVENLMDLTPTSSVSESEGGFENFRDGFIYDPEETWVTGVLCIVMRLSPPFKRLT